MPRQYQPTQDELNSSCFHHEDKGCHIVWYGYYRQKGAVIESPIDEILGIKRQWLERGNCKTHQVTVCHDYWQVGFHFNQLSKSLNPPRTFADRL